jgi:hypothetical protein
LELKKVTLEPMTVAKKEEPSSVIDMAKEVFGG